MLWLNSIAYVDLTGQELIVAAYKVGSVSQGAITLDNLRNMTYKDFRSCNDLAEQLIKKMKENEDAG